MRILLLLFIIFLGGCISTPMRAKILLNDGSLIIDEIKGENYQYRAYVKNTMDIGWNGDDPVDRKRVVQEALKDKCLNFQILDDRPLQTGSYLLGRPANTWIMRIKCD
jgi:hypothetical protein